MSADLSEISQYQSREIRLSFLQVLRTDRQYQADRRILQHVVLNEGKRREARDIDHT